MKITITGKAHKKGTSRKTGNLYDFYELHYNGPAPGVAGLAALTMTADPGTIDFDGLVVPGDYNVEFGPRGRIWSVEPVSGK